MTNQDDGVPLTIILSAPSGALPPQPQFVVNYQGFQVVTYTGASVVALQP